MKPQHIKADHCRACLSKRIKPLSIRKDFYLLNLDQAVSLSYSTCLDCQFIFHSEYVGDGFLTAYYQQSPMLRKKDPTPLETDQYKRQSLFLARNLELKGLRVLEIGAHTGNFLLYLKEIYNCKPYFDELSEEAKKILCSQKGLKDFRVSPKGQGVDLVILRHVLEHIYDIDAFLKYIHSILNDEGRLFIEIPDWSYLDQHTDPLIFEHLNQFNTYNLVLFLRRMGWQCDVVEKSICGQDPATPNRVQRVLARPGIQSQPGEIGFVQDFEEFYSKHYEAGNQAINEVLKKNGKKKKIALYPASHQTFMALYETKILESNVVGIFDIDPKKHGKKVRGIEIFPAEKLRKVKPELILLLTGGAFEYEIKDYFKSLGLSSEVISLRELQTT